MLEERRLPKSLAIGDKVDIRDKDFVWCRGSVKAIIESANREAVLGI